MANARIYIDLLHLSEVEKFVKNVKRIADQTTYPIARDDLRISLLALLEGSDSDGNDADNRNGANTLRS